MAGMNNFPKADIDYDAERLKKIRENIKAKSDTPFAATQPAPPMATPQADALSASHAAKINGGHVNMPPINVEGQAPNFVEVDKPSNYVEMDPISINVPGKAPRVAPQARRAAPTGRRGTNLGRAGNILKQAYGKQAEAIGAQAELAASQAQAESAALKQNAELARTNTQREIIENEQYLKDKGELIKAQQDEQVEKQKTVDESIKRLDDSRDAAKAELKDPWSEKSVGSKIMLAIGASLIGYAGGLRGDPGAGVRVIQSVLDRDMARQKANLANKRASVKDEQTAVGLARQQFSDGKTQDLAAQKLLWEGVQDKMNQMKLKALPAQQAAQLNQQLALVGTKTQEINTQLQLSIAENEVTGAKDQIGIAQAEDANRMKRAQLRQNAMIAQIKASQKDKKKLRPVSEATAKQLGELNGAEELVDSLEGSFGEDTSFASVVTKYIPGTPSNDYEATRDAFVQHMARGIYGATPPVAEINAIKKLIPSATEWSAKAPVMFEGLRALARDKKMNMLHSLGTGGFDVQGYVADEARKQPVAGEI